MPPLVTEEKLIAEVNKGARVFGRIQTDRLRQKERVELIFSTIAQTSPFLKLTRIPDGVAARKRHLCTTIESVRTSCNVQEDYPEHHIYI